MNVSVFYRGAMNKLVRINATDVDSHEQAIRMVDEEFATDPFKKKPTLALIERSAK